MFLVASLLLKEYTAFQSVFQNFIFSVFFCIKSLIIIEHQIAYKATGFIYLCRATTTYHLYVYKTKENKTCVFAFKKVQALPKITS